MADPWVLVLDPPSANGRWPVGGLPLALRLALDAQAAGAAAIVLAPGTGQVRSSLGDARLIIPVVEQVPLGSRSIRVPADYLVHPRLFAALAESPEFHGGGPDSQPGWDLPRRRFPLSSPHGFDPIRVADAASAKQAEVALFSTLRKATDGWTSRWLNRRISLRVSRLLVRTPLSPNAISVGILAVGLAGAWLAARGTYAATLAGAGLLQLQSILDGCDGEISRVTYRHSLVGEWLDTISDDVTSYAFFGAAAWGLYATRGVVAYLLAGAVVVIGGLLTSGIQYRYLIRAGTGDLLRHPVAGTPGEPALVTRIRPLFKRDTFIFLTFVGAGLGLIGPLILLMAMATIGLTANVIRVELADRRTTVERTGLPADRMD
jgi:phosphatidylglycerophosphate synthase